MKFPPIIILVLFCSTFLLSSCEKCSPTTVTAPTLDEEAWIPQRTGEVLIFKDAEGKRVKYMVANRTTQAVMPAGVPIDDCIERMDTRILVVLKDSAQTAPLLSTYILKTLTNFEVGLAIQDKGQWKINNSTKKHSTKQVNGIQYSEVYELNFTPESPKGIKQILYSKEKGYLSITYKDNTSLTRVQ